ncbi:MAG: helicase-associated domain-containing protein, partial [Thermicanus sp.]|nr:helicase-associated domain-containing protein [Thermicanus sp.]
MTMINPQNPLIIQSDRTLLLEVANPLFAEARDAISSFADLLKSPEYIHTYRITPLSLWNAASTGMGEGEILGILEKYAKYGVPEMIRKEIEDTVRRFGLLQLISDEGRLYLVTEDPLLLKEIWGYRSVR